LSIHETYEGIGKIHHQPRCDVSRPIIPSPLLKLTPLSALQIGSLGAEIFASLYALYGKKKEFDRARSLHLLPSHNQENSQFFLEIMFQLHAVVNKTKPQVSAFPSL
jgi:hypothetical protein